MSKKIFLIFFNVYIYYNLEDLNLQINIKNLFGDPIHLAAKNVLLELCFNSEYSYK